MNLIAASLMKAAIDPVKVIPPINVPKKGSGTIARGRGTVGHACWNFALRFHLPQDMAITSKGIRGSRAVELDNAGGMEGFELDKLALNSGQQRRSAVQ